MVVEDDPDCLDIVSEILEADGYEVLGAPDGQAALAALHGGRRPRLILLDLMLPIMNGWQFREAQLEDTALAHIPVIVFTAGRDAQGAARSLGAAGFLRKPIDMDDLLAAVARFVPND